MYLAVAAAVIRDGAGRILLAKRPLHVHQGGKWEFPGGKLQHNELPEAALYRELHEELGIAIQNPTPLLRVRHTYYGGVPAPERAVLLDVWEVHSWQGQAYGAEGQEVRWFAPSELPSLDVPAANRAIVTAARLPDYYAISPEWPLQRPWAEFLTALTRALDSGIRLMQLRQPQWQHHPNYPAAVRQAAQLCHEYDARLLLNGDWTLALDSGCDGVHLPARALRQYSHLRQPFPAHIPTDFWVAASCHNSEEIQLANTLPVHFITLSPVRHTQTHPNAQPLGWHRFFQYTERAEKPVYALGGLSPAQWQQARAHGAQGIAAIRGLWQSVPI